LDSTTDISLLLTRHQSAVCKLRVWLIETLSVKQIFRLRRAETKLNQNIISCHHHIITLFANQYSYT